MDSYIMNVGGKLPLGTSVQSLLHTSVAKPAKLSFSQLTLSELAALLLGYSRFGSNTDLVREEGCIADAAVFVAFFLSLDTRGKGLYVGVANRDLLLQ